jgi:pilus assembly protein CpaB
MGGLAMNIRTIATLSVAIVLGLIAVILVRNYLGAAKPAPGPTAGPTTPVVVAAQPIARGVPLDTKLLKVAYYPQDSVPDGVFHSITEVNAAGAPARIVLRAFTPNEPILLTQVTGPGGKLNLSGVVDEGMRAVSLRSNDIAGVAGFVLPGDRVDILLTREVHSGDQSQAVTQVIAENIKVLGVDQSDDDAADKPVVAHAVTIEVTPDQAQAISLAQTLGNVSLTLRHVADATPLTRKAMTGAALGFTTVPKPKVASDGHHGGGPEIRVTRGVETVGYTVSRF